MKIFAPEYYHAFHCLASSCPDSCCQEWTVDVDAASAAYYRTLPGALGERLRSVLQDMDGSTVMTITDGRCPMWRQDGLCEIQAALGHDALCRTCRDFPRLRHDYGDFTELGLELSCPEAARLIFSATSSHMRCNTLPGGDAPEYDTNTMATLRRSRDTVLRFLDSKAYPLPQMLAVILLYAHGVQSELDGGKEMPWEPDVCLNAARSCVQAGGDISAVVHFFADLEILTQRWRDRLHGPLIRSASMDAMLPLARYLIQRYWLQAVSDFDLISRAKLVLISCLLVSALGGDPLQTAQLFSKEIENDPDNLDAILDGAYACPAFTDQNLLNLLLNP